MKLCDKCFAGVEPDAEFCGECGAPIDGASSTEGSDSLVYPEIARANLLRMRGAVDEAEKVCLGVLKRYPNNPSAHVLLGDIHLEQGHLQDARHWYEMALDLTPDNQALQSKLARASADMERESKRHAEASLELLEGKSLVGYYVAGGILLAAVAGVAFWLGFARSNLRDKRLDVIEPISVNGTAPRATESAPRPPEAAEPEAPAPQSPATMTSSEAALLNSLSQDLGPLAGRIGLLMQEPTTGTVWLTLAGQDVGPTADTLEAAQAAASTIAKAPGTARVNVRVLDPTKREVRYSGSVTVESLAGAKGTPNTAEWAASILINASPPISR